MFCIKQDGIRLCRKQVSYAETRVRRKRVHLSLDSNDLARTYDGLCNRYRVSNYQRGTVDVIAISAILFRLFGRWCCYPVLAMADELNSSHCNLNLYHISPVWLLELLFVSVSVLFDRITGFTSVIVTIGEPFNIKLFVHPYEMYPFFSVKSRKLNREDRKISYSLIIFDYFQWHSVLYFPRKHFKLYK